MIKLIAVERHSYFLQKAFVLVILVSAFLVLWCTTDLSKKPRTNKSEATTQNATSTPDFVAANGTIPNNNTKEVTTTTEMAQGVLMPPSVTASGLKTVASGTRPPPKITTMSPEQEKLQRLDME